MGRQIQRLTALKLAKLTAPGMYADGEGLYLQIKAPREPSKGAGTRSWVFRYRYGGRKTPRDMGLGSAGTLSLGEARDLAADARRQLTRGIDPIVARKKERAAAFLESSKSLTFEKCAAVYIEAHGAGWRNEKHKDQWTATLKTYAYPTIGRLAVASIDVGMVLKVLEQKCPKLPGKPTLWNGKTETASRVRGRMEAILDWARARGYRQGENPARWRGNLDKLLPARVKVQRVQHHPALSYEHVGAFVADLHKREGTAARALEFLIFTAARTGEVMGARWAEIDLDAGVWTIPADRMKSGRIHRVPLSAAAKLILSCLEPDEALPGAYVFSGGKAGKPLSANALLALLDRMKRTGITAHGFRSTFRDWAAERTNYPREVAEMALAHVVADKTEAAYRRGDLFEKRARLMEEWAKYCGMVAKPAAVVPLRRKRV